jgi:3',5'-nucleoside bisphosphate phosphatase
MTYDLHAHTSCSDGSLTPSELVARAQANGVGALAVTDHDATDGLPEAMAAAASAGVRLVPGVEISVTWQRQTVHVVGLCIDPAHVPLQQGLARLREFRVSRAHEISLRLQKKNIADAYAQVCNRVRGSVISRTHFAQFLVAGGYVGDMGQAFKQYLGRGRVADVPGRWASLEDAVSWIRGAGGIAVVAHPARYDLTFAKLKRLLQEFRECGGAAMEVASGCHAPAETNQMTRLATELDLLGSSGSDYHGPEKPWVELGRLPALAAEVVPVWSAFAPAYVCPTPA